MRILTPDLSEGAKRDIEEAIRDPADKAIQMLGLVTTSLPAADDEKSSFGWIFDTTLGQPKFSDGTNWLTFSLSTHTHTSFGAVTFTGAITTNGQVVFPATQNPSANANTLDDYEEGTFTPVLTFGGGSTGMTFSQQNARYTKIGNLVHVSLLLSMTAKGSSTGTAEISGLPFTASGTIVQGVGACYAAFLTTVAMPMSRIVQGTAVISLFDFTGSTVAVLTDADFQDSSQLGISISYFV